jgi:GT2 family glycosyltransferase/glycosyltransferase involved in cell wall biosynthesis/SAM-dependent methyltransferase
MEQKDLSWTGERLVTSLNGDIVLEHLHRYAIAAELAMDKDVLDIACGEGYGSFLMAAQARSVVGVDIANDAILHAQGKYARPNLRFCVGDCRAIPLAEKCVDLVVSFETLEHISEHEAFIRDIHRVLRPGGLLFISSPDRQNYRDKPGYANPFHSKELYRHEFEALLKSFFPHAMFFLQRVALGSYLAPADSISRAQCGTYRGDWSKIDFETGVSDALYSLGLCSDLPVPPLRVGLFEFGHSERDVFITPLKVDRGTADTLRQKIDEADRTSSQLQQKCSKLERTCQDLKQVQNEMERKLESAASLRGLKNLINKQFSLTFRAAEEQTQKLQEVTAALETFKQQSQAKLESSETVVQQLTTELSRRESTLRELEARLEQNKSAFQQLNSQLAQRDIALRDLLAKSSGALQQSAELHCGAQKHLERIEQILPQMEIFLQSPYLKMIGRIRDVARNVLPRDGSVLVVSKGDDDLLNLECGTVRHFPQAQNGLYAGFHPADGAEAIAHLEDLRKKGAAYLLFPSTSFWWLDYYQDFKAHLRARYRRIWIDDNCIIYSLTQRFVAEQKILATSKPISDLRPTSQPLYRKMVADLRRIVSETLPKSATVLVVSKGDEDLLDLAGRRAWHFPRTQDGTYAGFHPKDSSWAIAQVETLRHAGADFLVFPATAFWWFDFYHHFARYLQVQHREVWCDSNCRIFQLTDSQSGEHVEKESGHALELNVSLSKRFDTKGEFSRIDFGPTARPLKRNLVTVAIPIFNAYDDVVRCVESVIRHGKHSYQLLLLDDCSTDERLWPMLLAWASLYPQIRIMRNETNLGFTGTVNKACKLVPGDVILLNSDTLVTPDWIEKLSACASSRSNVATVTAVSNAAGAFSIPVNNQDNPIPEHLSLDEVAAIVEQHSRRIWLEVPTGNGFCMYVTRKVLNAIGGFDETNFPRGYGEENDFCMRARSSGFVNLIDDSTFIYHKGTASFRGDKARLLEDHLARLNQLHPTYKHLVTEWLANDPLDVFRSDLNLQFKGPRHALRAQGRRCVLFIVHDGAGGSIHLVEDLACAVSAEHRSLVLKTGLNDWTLFQMDRSRMIPLRHHRFSEPWEADKPMSDERLGVMRDVCRTFEVDLAHVHHLLANGPQTLEVLRSFSIPTVFSFHDYYPICPTINLLDETWTFCGGNCTPSKGECSVAVNWFPSGVPPLKHRYVYEHRERMARAFKHCSCFVTPSHFMWTMLKEKFSSLEQIRTRVIPHGRDLSRCQLAVTPQPSVPARVVCMGNFNESKGTGLLLRLLELNEKSGRPFEFHFFGAKASHFKPQTVGGIDHGAYERDRLPELLRRVQPSFSLIASVWPETFCYTLSESWAMGLPVFAANLGALQERIQHHGGGWLLDPCDALKWYREMAAVLDDPADYAQKLEQVAKIDLKSVEDMAAEYLQVYNDLLALTVNGETHREAVRFERPVLGASSEAKVVSMNGASHAAAKSGI